MGGLGGHCKHLWEDRDLTFRDLRLIINDVRNASFPIATEKSDGVQLSVTCVGDRVMWARSHSDLAHGYDLHELAKKFSDRPNVHDAFVDGFKVITKCVLALPESVRKRAFENGKVWHSFEIMHHLNPNVIHYGSNCLVLHRFAERMHPKGDMAFDVLNNQVASMELVANESGWRFFGPGLGKLNPISDRNVILATNDSLDSTMRRWKLREHNTLRNLIETVVRDRVDVLLPFTSHEKKNQLVCRIAFCEGPTIIQLTKGFPKSISSKLREMARSRVQIVNEALMPIERVVTRLSIELLRGYRSIFVEQHDEEIKRLKLFLKETIDSLPDIPEVIHHASRFSGVEDVATSAEGIVFEARNGKVYKVTGAFSPVNAILGMIKYNRLKK